MHSSRGRRIAFVALLSLLITSSSFAQGTPPLVPHATASERMQSLLGLFVFTMIAFIIGRLRGARKPPSARLLVWGYILMFAFGAIVLFAPNILEAVQLIIQKLLDFSNAGARMVFGDTTIDMVAPVHATKDPSSAITGWAHVGFIFAIIVLPTILFVSMLTAMLYHLGVLTWVVHGLAWIMQKTMGTSGAETLSTAANIFVGQTEAPLIVRPFIAAATVSELFAIMVGGFSNIATGVLVTYTQFLAPYVRNAGGHLALACFISAPATLVVSKLIMPEVSRPTTAGGVKFKVDRVDSNLFDAATRGTSEGLALALNVAAMLITFTALIAMLNALFGGATGWMHLGTASVVDGRTIYSGLSLEQVFGWIFAPVAWLTGIEWKYCPAVGSLLGLKTVLNEFIAYLNMSQNFAKDPSYLSPRAALLATYGLCGFANFASVGIQIGGISVLAPDRRSDLSRIGLLAMFGGAIATLMGACIVGILL